MDAREAMAMEEETASRVLAKLDAALASCGTRKADVMARCAAMAALLALCTGMRCGTFVTSTVGVMTDDDALATWRDGMTKALRVVASSWLLLYGRVPDFDFGDVEVVSYGARKFEGRG